MDMVDVIQANTGFIRIGVTARVAKLADALDLGSSTERCAGSTPVSRTELNFNSNKNDGLNANPCIQAIIIYRGFVFGSAVRTNKTLRSIRRLLKIECDRRCLLSFRLQFEVEIFSPCGNVCIKLCDLRVAVFGRNMFYPGC